MNVFTNFPPAVAWLVIAITLVSMAQFGSTERLAAAFAWLVFVAILLANGTQAFTNLSSMVGANTSTGGGSLPKKQ